uniref:Uncharacterized protein n=1 Tax=Candidatus Kentrum sp. SD TaxID=2126332 RepID=A0A451BQH5_9GAMM|nr:MAG: hypothetical protein BECKSD772D_GA0070982_11236 [Candidatus Kentron sp. SD]
MGNEILAVEVNTGFPWQAAMDTVNHNRVAGCEDPGSDYDSLC